MILYLLTQSEDERRECLALRRRVFIEEQGVPEAIERDTDDAAALHFLALESGVTPVGTARVVEKAPGVAKIGRVAVLPEWRGQGIGAELMAFLLTTLELRHTTTAYLHAQESVVGFYEKLGFSLEGARFFEAGIPHFVMRRQP